MKPLLVKDYMSSTPLTIPSSAIFKDVVEKLIQKETNGLVVVDGEDKVVGIISSWDIIQYIVPDYLEQDKHLANFEAADLFQQRINELLEVPVSDFMTKSVHTLHADDAIMTAAIKLSEYRIRQLPVVDDAGKLIGYINRTDIKHAIADVLGLKLGR